MRSVAKWPSCSVNLSPSSCGSVGTCCQSSNFKQHMWRYWCQCTGPGPSSDFAIKLFQFAAPPARETKRASKIKKRICTLSLWNASNDCKEPDGKPTGNTSDHVKGLLTAWLSQSSCRSMLQSFARNMPLVRGEHMDYGRTRWASEPKKQTRTYGPISSQRWMSHARFARLREYPGPWPQGPPSQSKHSSHHVSGSFPQYLLHLQHIAAYFASSSLACTLRPIPLWRSTSPERSPWCRCEWQQLASFRNRKAKSPGWTNSTTPTPHWVFLLWTTKCNPFPGIAPLPSPPIQQQIYRTVLIAQQQDHTE